MEKFVSVGKILNFHGVQGEAKIGFSKNRQDFILGLDGVYLKNGNDYRLLKITHSRLNKTFAIMKFDGINSINELLPLKGELLFVKESTIRENLEEDEFLIDELVGMEVYDKDGKKLGFVVGVSNNGANDMLSVKTKSGNISLVPFVKAIVLEVVLSDGKIIINNLEGLLE